MDSSGRDFGAPSCSRCLLEKAGPGDRVDESCIRPESKTWFGTEIGGTCMHRKTEGLHRTFFRRFSLLLGSAKAGSDFLASISDLRRVKTGQMTATALLLPSSAPVLARRSSLPHVPAPVVLAIFLSSYTVALLRTLSCLVAPSVATLYAVIPFQLCPFCVSSARRRISVQAVKSQCCFRRHFPARAPRPKCDRNDRSLCL